MRSPATRTGPRSSYTIRNALRTESSLAAALTPLKSARILRSSMHSIALGESVHAVIIVSNLALIAGEAARASMAAPTIGSMAVGGVGSSRSPMRGRAGSRDYREEGSSVIDCVKGAQAG